MGEGRIFLKTSAPLSLKIDDDLSNEITSSQIRRASQHL